MNEEDTGSLFDVTTFSTSVPKQVNCPSKWKQLIHVYPVEKGECTFKHCSNEKSPAAPTPSDRLCTMFRKVAKFLCCSLLHYYREVDKMIRIRWLGVENKSCQNLAQKVLLLPTIFSWVFRSGQVQNVFSCSEERSANDTERLPQRSHGCDACLQP